MAYWWVSQQEMHRAQRLGHYLWAPIQNESRQSFFHWRNMTEVMPGDVIFSYADGAFPSIAVARSEAYEETRPADLDFPDGTADGRKLDASYRDLTPAIPLEPVRKLLSLHLPRRQAPLYPDGSDYPGFLFSLNGRAGRVLLDYLASPAGQTGDEAISPLVLTSVTDSETRRALASSRRGLGDYRKAVFELWEEKCAVTRSGLFDLLRARHIKPWRDCSNEERLDPHNGLLLSPLYDAAFEAGLISFDTGGRIMLSNTVSDYQWDLLALRRTTWLEHLKDEHQSYLAYHRQQVYLGEDKVEDTSAWKAPFTIP